MPRPSALILTPTSIERSLYSMAPSQRARLECFYCCKKSAQIRYPGIKRWKCERCDAVNHLDENGEISDPPSASTVRIERYAESIARPSSPLFDVPAGSAFCVTCVKNQHLYNESLAAYFPSEDAPDFEEYEKALPAFKKGLEERYPQICEDCEPGALAWLRNTNYQAKADNVRRIMDKTRPGHFSYQSDWRNLVVWLGGWIWFVSWLGQISWDVVSLMTSETGPGGLVGEDYKNSILSAATHLWQAMGLSSMVLYSPEPMNLVARYALVLGLLSFWWNPRLQLHLEVKRGRIVGQWDFYKLQATLFAIRCAAWAYLAPPNTYPESGTIDTVHYCMLFFGALFTYISFRHIQIDYTPRVLFQDLTPERLVTRRAQPGQNGVAQGNPSNPRGFSINDFAPQTQAPIPAPAPYRPLTPPTDDDGDSTMDWTPSQTPLPPAPLYRPIRPMDQHSQPDPFHGHLPANVVSPAHRLRNPPNKPTFRSVSAIKKQMKYPTNPADRGMQANVSDTSEVPSLGIADLSPMKFEDPKFFPQSDPREETGLENLFSNIFSIAEEPAEVRAAQQLRAQSPRRPARTSFISKWFFSLVVVIFVAVGYKFHPLRNTLATPWIRNFLALDG